MTNSNGSGAYLTESLNKKKQEIAAALEKEYLTAGVEISAAEDTQKQSGRGASADYLNYINKYGYNAEKTADAGLAASGISQSDRVRAYQSYQSRLGQAAADYAGSRSQIYAALLQAQTDAGADTLQAESSYYDDLYDDYWKNKNFEYKLERDALSDERYNTKNGTVASAAKSTAKAVSAPVSAAANEADTAGAYYTHSDVSGTDFRYYSGDSFNYELSIYTQSALNAVAVNKARELTGNGSHAADAAAGAALMDKARSEYKLSTQQLNDLSRYLAGEKYM